MNKLFILLLEIITGIILLIGIISSTLIAGYLLTFLFDWII